MESVSHERPRISRAAVPAASATKRRRIGSPSPAAQRSEQPGPSVEVESADMSRREQSERSRSPKISDCRDSDRERPRLVDVYVLASAAASPRLNTTYKQERSGVFNECAVLSSATASGSSHSRPSRKERGFLRYRRGASLPRLQLGTEASLRTCQYINDTKRIGRVRRRLPPRTRGWRRRGRSTRSRRVRAPR